MGLFDDGFVGSKGAAPEPVEVGAELGQTVGVDPVDAAVARGLINDQPSVLEDLEVLRDGRSADRQPTRELSHGAGAIGEPFEDCASCVIAEGGPSSTFVSLHAP